MDISNNLILIGLTAYGFVIIIYSTRAWYNWYNSESRETLLWDILIIISGISTLVQSSKFIS